MLFRSGFGDGDGDGLNDNDFVGHVNVLQGAAIEIVDVNNLLIGDVNTHESADPEVFQLYVEAQNGKVTFDGTVEVEGSADAQGKVIVRATNGATETSRGRITTDGIILIGEGDFIFDQPNEIFDQNAPSVGRISADISGNLIFNNELALQVSRNSYETLNPNTTVGINSLKIRQLPDGSAGNLTITTSDDDVTQSSLAPVIVESLTTIDIGTGSIT